MGRGPSESLLWHWWTLAEDRARANLHVRENEVADSEHVLRWSLSHLFPACPGHRYQHSCFHHVFAHALLLDHCCC